MVDQTTIDVEHNGRAKPGVAGSISGLAHDAIALAELQAQLLAVDLRDGRSQAELPIALVTAGLLLALGTVPVLLLGIGWLLVAYLGFSEAAAVLTTASVALTLAGTMVWIGWRRLQSAIAILTRSRQELAENIHWLKETLRRPAGHPRTTAGSNRK